jgi:hypothetical protein
MLEFEIKSCSFVCLLGGQFLISSSKELKLAVGLRCAAKVEIKSGLFLLLLWLARIQAKQVFELLMLIYSSKVYQIF